MMDGHGELLRAWLQVACERESAGPCVWRDTVHLVIIAMIVALKAGIGSSASRMDEECLHRVSTLSDQAVWST